MKNIDDIEVLLDRYWEGETTLEEERALKAYFTSGDVDERLRAVAPFFQALREEQAVRYVKAKAAPLRPVHFAWHKWAAAASVALLIVAGLWWAQREKPVVGEVSQHPPARQEQIVPQENPASEGDKTLATQEEERTPVLVKKTPAGHRKSPASQRLTPEEEQAMEEIKAALALVSSKIKKGRQEAAKGAIHLENVDKVFKKNS